MLRPLRRHLFVPLFEFGAAICPTNPSFFFRGMIVDYFHNSISSLSNKPDTKWSIKTVHVTVCPQNSPLKQAAQESQNSDSSELLQQSMADIRQGWTSAMFTICNTLLADHTGPAIGFLASCHLATSSSSFTTHILPVAIAIHRCHLPFPCAIYPFHFPLPFGL